MTGISQDEVTRLCRACEQALSASQGSIHIPDGYLSVPLCAIDAIYSIGVRYEGVENVVERYRSYWLAHGVDANSPAHTTAQFLREFGARDDLGTTLFGNRQLTSPRGGIPKADAVLRLIKVLGSRDFDIQTTDQLRAHFKDEKLDAAVRSIHGQSSGISAKYLFLLAGVEDAIKPDRMIVRFVSASIGRKVTPLEAQDLLVETVPSLRRAFPDVTPRLLDHVIWHSVRGR